MMVHPRTQNHSYLAKIVRTLSPLEQCQAGIFFWNLLFQWNPSVED
jgi:hypothetical protein